MRRKSVALGLHIRGMASAALAAASVLALLCVLVVAHLAARPAYAGQSDLYVVCPSPIDEGETGHMQIRWPGYAGISVTIFTYHGAYTAGSGDFVGYNGVRMHGESDDDSVWVPVITNEDDLTEHDETFAIGFWVTGVWLGCVVEIVDDDTPWIKYVEISSRPVKGETYRAGESIDVTLALDREVEIEGDLQVSLHLGEDGEDEDETLRGAAYHSGSGTRYLVFRYRVQAADLDTDGVSVDAGEMDDDRIPTSGFEGTGAINAKDTDVPIDYTHRGVDPSSDHQVDGRPYVQSVNITSAPPDAWDAYRANQVIELTMRFNTDVVVEEPVHAGLYIGEALRQAPYLRGSGSDTLVFAYTVRPGDMDSQGVMVAAGSRSTGLGGSGAIKAEGTDVVVSPTYEGTGHLADHKVDTSAPSVASISFESRPADGVAYDTGESIEVEVAFDQEVTIDGDPMLELDVGGVVRLALYRPGVAEGESTDERVFVDAAVFHYAVQDGDLDADGVGISANSLLLNGGHIRDSAGNAAGLSHEAVAADSGQKVDASPEG